MNDNLTLAVEQWINGDENGFNVIYNETYNYVFAKTRAIMKNYDDAADLLQEVYIAASRSLDTLKDVNNLYAWLGGIAYRQGMKIFNKQRDVLLSDEGEGLFEVQECLDKSVQPGAEMEERETANIIKDMLDELPPEQSAVVVAYYYDEMSVTDIASTLGVSTGTIKSRLNYARKKIEELVLAKEEKEGIRLHSVTMPSILLAVYMYMEGFAISMADAQTAYNSISTRMGYTSIGANVIEAVQNASINTVYTGASASNVVASSAMGVGVGSMGFKTMIIAIMTLASLGGGVFVGNNVYQHYSNEIAVSSTDYVTNVDNNDTDAPNNANVTDDAQVSSNASESAKSSDASADMIDSVEFTKEEVIYTDTEMEDERYDKIVLMGSSDGIDKINRDLNDLYERIEELFDSLSNRPQMPYHGSISLDVICNNNGIFSVKLNHAILGLGTGALGLEGLNYDINTGKMMSINDLLGDDDEIYKIIKAEVKEKYKEDSYAKILFNDIQLDDMKNTKEFFMSHEAFWVNSNGNVEVHVMSPDSADTYFVELPMKKNKKFIKI